MIGDCIVIPVLKKILFATDLSETAHNAFGMAVALADRLEGELLVVHILKQEPSFNTEVLKIGLGDDLYQEMEQKKSQSARNVLIGKRTEAHAMGEKIHALFSEAAACLVSPKPLQVRDFVIEAASISEEIVRLAEVESCDMIVMAHRRRKLFADASGENILKKVLRATDIPVVLVPPKTGNK